MSVSASDQPGLIPNRACRNCVQIKAKCVPHEDHPTTTCQRCHRLGKVCATPAPVSRKRPRTKPGRATQLEQEDVNSDRLLVEHHESSNMLLTPPVSNRCDISPSTAAQEQDQQDMNNLSAPEVIPWGRASGTASVNAISPEIGHPFAATPHEKYFEIFRSSLSQHFPFIVIPPDVSPTAFSKQRPFLYTACVMTGAHRNPPFQSRVVRDMLKYVSERMIQSGEKSFDLLQGLMIAAAWYHVYSHDNPQLMNLLHLAKALTIDLGLNRPPGSGLHQLKMSTDAQTMLYGPDINGPKRAIEQDRICLAVYHVSSKLCACFRRMDDIRWHDYLEGCCQYLEQNPQHPSDGYAAALVRLDRLVERYTGVEGIRPGKSMPLQAYVRLFTLDMEQFAIGLSAWLREDPMMVLHIRSAELCLYETVIGSDVGTHAYKVEALHACLDKVAIFFNESFLELSAENLVSIPFLVWASVAHALDVLAKLSFVVVPGWDINWARQTTPGFIGITDKIIAKLKETYEVEQMHPDNVSIRFKIFAGKLQWCQQWYNSKIAADAAVTSGATGTAQGVDINVPDIENSSSAYLGEFSDMMWQDFMNDWPTRTDAEFSFNI